jgi:tRNA modification GTPase
LTAEDEVIIALSNRLNHLIAINKSDLNNQKLVGITNSKTLKVSAKTGLGLNDLKKAIIEPFASQEIENTGFLITDSRHYDLLLRAKSEIESSNSLIDAKTSEEIVLIGLHNALRYLGEITGETTTEEMLTRIFSTFCIGK